MDGFISGSWDRHLNLAALGGSTEQSEELTLLSPSYSQELAFIQDFGVFQEKTSARKAGDVPSRGSGLTGGIGSSTTVPSGTAPPLQPSLSQPGRAVLQGQLVHDHLHHQNLWLFGLSSFPVLLAPVYAARCTWPRRGREEAPAHRGNAGGCLPTRGGAASFPLLRPGTCRSSLLSPREHDARFPLHHSSGTQPFGRAVLPVGAGGTGCAMGDCPGEVFSEQPQSCLSPLCLARALLEAACSSWQGFVKQNVKPWRVL
ncbi:uncharacterized protein LOC118250438 isoform X2 [Cygnus atratus]|uniref:uncharacterized protein LOC118250438 isoform X2 n=1 Tax=Cygnus atratus TaxID=8868 RepID=UPI0015D5AEAF|nr:uncharacterized protein LOC118250438 isoform X2 [Cygnus atratus]